MSALEFLILLISAMSCCAAPKLETDHCQKPEPIKGAQLQGEWNEESYPPGKVANFACLPQYTQDGPIRMACIEGSWLHIAKGQCKETDRQCGPPPAVQFADTVSIKKANYKSGEFVEYRCPNYYILQGNKIVRCLNGIWDEAPVCLEPCTVKEKDMQDNNIQPKWRSDRKLYSEHGDIMTFICNSGYEALPDTQMRSTCEDGKLQYPKCFRRGFCILQQRTMDISNVHYNISTVVDHGQTIVFQCNQGMMPEGNLEAKCENGNISYPKCTNATTTCIPPPDVRNAKIDGQVKASYASGEKATYLCNDGYSLQRSFTGEALCKHTQWFNLPVCRKIGEQCGPPPTVQFGDTVKSKKANYKSGDSVEYRCPNYYLLQGNRIINCLNGVWDEAPVCLEPCTAKVKDMKENNIQLKWMAERKLYSVHGDSMTFICNSGYEALPDTQMRSTCEHGKLQYPKCFTTGFCVLEQSTMNTNNIHYNVSTVVDNEQTIVFHCNEGMMAENKLEAECHRGNINYPKCTASKRCKTPEILNGFLSTEQQASYDSGSYVKFECDEDYVLNSHIIVKCENGEWTDLPVCHHPCKISSEDLTKHNIQLLHSHDPKKILDRNYEHGTELRVVCKPGYRRPGQAALVIECYDGKLRYPRCFSGKTCRIDQDELDYNNLELDEVHHNEVFYAEGDTIQFKCKSGFRHPDKPTGTCAGQQLCYPTCTADSLV